MLSQVLYGFGRGVRWLAAHPQFNSSLLLIIVIPLAFLWSGQQFLDAGKANQDRLQKDRIGLMHDVFVSLAHATNLDTELLQQEIDAVAALNTDISQFRVVLKSDTALMPVAALDRARIGVAEENVAPFQHASIRTDDSVIFEFYGAEGRVWQSFRTAQLKSGETFFIFTENSLKHIDDAFANRIQIAYYYLAAIFVVIALLLYRHLRLINYSYLYREAKKANELKDLFTNMIAHELRAPLTAIKGYASLITEHKDADPVSKEHGLRIGKAAERLIVIVSDLLDVARIQSGKLQITQKRFNLSALIGEVLDEIGGDAKKHGITLETKGVDEKVYLNGDQKRLHQALINLVSNAIKYTQEGTITIVLTQRYGVTEIRIQDTGMGISADDQKELFAPFFRVQSDEVSTITGTGLGMWITKELVELMGGTIAVESIKGVGTHIVIQFTQTEQE